MAMLFRSNMACAAHLGAALGLSAALVYLRGGSDDVVAIRGPVLSSPGAVGVLNDRPDGSSGTTYGHGLDAADGSCRCARHLRIASVCLG